MSYAVISTSMAMRAMEQELCAKGWTNCRRTNGGIGESKNDHP